MALITKRRAENISGPFYVDSSCIDCDTCRWLAPETFARAGDQSHVYQQPNDELQTIKALQALLSCPTTSIGNSAKSPLISSVRDMFPLHISERIFYCGYHSAKSYGAASYLIIHPEGNILVDSPRYNGPLIEGIKKLGGVRYIYLTHRDDVADHQQFATEFGCEQIMYKADISGLTEDIDIQLPANEIFSLYPDVQIIPTPGHTEGHSCLLAFGTYLFSGDHLSWSVRLQQLYAFRDHCWFDWSSQIASMEKLLAYDFQWVLPGHGRRFHTNTSAEMRTALETCISWMRNSQ